MNRYIAYVFLIILVLSCKSPNPKADASTAAIDEYIARQLKEHQIPGAAIAIIKEGKLIYESYRGEASVISHEKVDQQTIFRLYSMSKLMTATAIFRLYQEGKIELDDELSKWLPNIPSTWGNIKIHQLIAHSSGLPDYFQYDLSQSDAAILQQLYEAELEFQAGERFAYNQTNYWLLAMLIEQVSKQSFEDYILATQFAKEDVVIFNSNHTDEIARRSAFHIYNSIAKRYELAIHNTGARGHAANGINLNLSSLIRWNKRLDDNALLQADFKQKMWRSYPFENAADEFLYGWASYHSNGKTSVGFTGSGVCGFRKFLADELTIIFLSNGFKGAPVHNEIIDELARLVLQ